VVTRYPPSVKSSDYISCHKEDVWKWSGLRQRIFGILLALPRDELRKTSDFTLSDREFLAFARSSDDARERLSQVCEMRLFALEEPTAGA
jgi:hypothetical protein